MLKTSEWVSLGHPDKIADYISCAFLDAHLEIDPDTRFAVEVQIKDNFVTLAGEVSSQAEFNEDETAKIVREAVNSIGYDKEYQSFWGDGNSISGDDLQVFSHIGSQSPDIALGIENSGWGDQGIFWGMAANEKKSNFMPLDYYYAARIGRALYESRYAGLDIKTQVTMHGDKIAEIILAVPMTEEHERKEIYRIAAKCCDDRHYGSRIVLNGTGRFVKHGPLGDCGTTGRKLVADLYGGNCRIGGGSPWTKDGTKADLSLNMLARKYALDYLKEHSQHSEVHCSMSCAIGRAKVLVTLYNESMQVLQSYKRKIAPEEVMESFKLKEARYRELCRKGLFYDIH